MFRPNNKQHKGMQTMNTNNKGTDHRWEQRAESNRQFYSQREDSRSVVSSGLRKQESLELLMQHYSS